METGGHDFTGVTLSHRPSALYTLFWTLLAFLGISRTENTNDFVTLLLCNRQAEVIQ
jgi:hypothetical protein